MPSTVLITSSTCCVTSDSTSSGDAPGSPTRTETVGKSNRRKAIDAQLEITRRAHHDQRQNDHRRKDRTADTYFS
jgi:hypothetical protein